MSKEGKIQNIKYAPPPPDVPMLGKQSTQEVSFIGRTNYAAGLEEKKYIFGIKRIDRRHHVYVIGKSGMGKSKLIELLVRQDIAHGKGVCLIDPHGDIMGAILDFIPEQRMHDVCVLDPSDTTHPTAFNIFSNVDPLFRHQLVQSIIEVLKKQFGEHWTFRLEHVTRFTMLALLDYPEATLQGITLMLRNASFRKRVIPHIHDEMVKRFWETEFDAWSTQYDAEAIIPLENKMSQFLSHPLMRGMTGEFENKINFEELINNQSIILINLCKGKMGEENANFWGSMIIAKLKQAIISRATISARLRNDYYVYIDGCNTLVTDTFESVLEEAEKVGICMTLSHQYLHQLPARMQAAVLGNIGNIIVFRVGGEDAEKLEAEMTPLFKAKDMINLGLQEFYIKMTIDGETHDPFSAETLKILPVPHASFAGAIIEESFSRFGVTGEDRE